MADSYTTRGGMIKPEPGQSLNTWGQKLNDYNFDIVDKGLYGFQAIAVTTDFSLTRTNGDSTSTQINKGIHLTGTPTADFAVTALSYEHILLYRNSSGKSATIKVSAGTGVTLADGQTAFLAYNSTLGDITNVSPNHLPGNAVIDGSLTVGGQISGVTAATLGTQAVNKTQMDNAIALAGGTGAATGTLRITSTDTTAKFLNSAISVDGIFISKSVTSPSGNEGLLISGTGKFLNSGTDTTAGYLSQKLSASITSSYAALAASFSTQSAGGNESQRLTITYDGGQAIMASDLLLPF